MSSNGTLNVAGSGSIGGHLTVGGLSVGNTLSAGALYTPGCLYFSNSSVARVGYSQSCTFICNNNSNWLRCNDSGTLTWKGYTVNNGSSNSSDGRYKFILDDINTEDCYNIIKDTNLYAYALLDKRIDTYKNISEISDELKDSCYMNVHMGIIAQDIMKNDLSRYIIYKHPLEEEGGEKGEYRYGIDNYAYTTAIHGALKHEISIREEEIKDLRKEIEDLKNMLK